MELLFNVAPYILAGLIAVPVSIMITFVMLICILQVIVFLVEKLSKEESDAKNKINRE